MVNLIDKIFVKNAEHPELPEVRERYGLVSSVLGVVVNVLIATAKLILGVIAGSIAIVADAVNNFSDAGAAIVSFVSFKISAKPADRDHPFGHARIEYVCSMIVAFLILIVGFELMSESISGFSSDEARDNTFSPAMYIILGIAILSKLLLSSYYRRVGKKINSSVITASATDSLMDAASTCAVLISAIIIRITGLWFIDSIVGIAVSIMIFVAGIRILNDTKNALLGEAPLDEVICSIKEIVAQHDYVVGIHDLLVHNYGPNHYIASFHAEVDGNCDVYILHDAIDNLEREINAKLGILCTIHLDPIEANNDEVNRLKAMTVKIVGDTYSGANIHDFRVVTGPTHTNLIFDVAMPFEVKESNESIVNNINEKIKEVNETYFTVITIDRE